MRSMRCSVGVGCDEKKTRRERMKIRQMKILVERRVMMR